MTNFTSLATDSAATSTTRISTGIDAVIRTLQRVPSDTFYSRLLAQAARINNGKEPQQTVRDAVAAIISSDTSPAVNIEAFLQRRNNAEIFIAISGQLEQMHTSRLDDESLEELDRFIEDLANAPRHGDSYLQRLNEHATPKNCPLPRTVRTEAVPLVREAIISSMRDIAYQKTRLDDDIDGLYDLTQRNLNQLLHTSTERSPRH